MPREVRLLAGVFCFVRKFSKIGVTRCHILRLKCTKFDFRWGSAPDPVGELTALPQTPVFKGPTSKGREGKGKGRGDGKRRGRERDGRGREGNRTTQNLVATPLPTKQCCHPFQLSGPERVPVTALLA